VSRLATHAAKATIRQGKRPEDVVVEIKERKRGLFKFKKKNSELSLNLRLQNSRRIF